MARQDQLNTIALQQNGRKTLIQKITITTSGVVTTLGTTTASAAMYGAPVVSLTPGSTLCLQPDQDMYYSFCPSGATTAVTTNAGAVPGVRVLQYQQEFVTLKGDGMSAPNSLAIDSAIDIVATAAGTLSIFLVE